MSGSRREERLARALLCRATEPATTSVVELVDHVGPAAAVEAIRDWGGGLSQQIVGGVRARLAAADPAADLARIERVGGRFLIPGDAEWPEPLAVLHGITQPCLGLYVRGPLDLAEAVRRAVAIVGARAATDYGTYVAAELAAGLADLGWSIVSGGAYGIDGAAHRGALAAGGPTVAVLACGVDVAYPKGHDALLSRIAAEGLVVSEHAPGCAPQRLRFLVRNRLIAALSQGTVVVEAAARSGAAKTASYAADLGRELMAVPGPVTSAMSAGTNQLIRDRDARLVARVPDVVDLLGGFGVDAAEPERGPERPEDHLDLPTLKVLDALPVTQPAPIDQLMATAALSRDEVAAALRRLERQGLAEALDDRWRVTDAARRAG